MNKRGVYWWLRICAALLLLTATCLFSLSIGSVSIPLKKVLLILFGNESPGSVEYSIRFQIRLPRILLGSAVGGSLSLAGVLLQGMFRNPLVEPYTLGISGGAALGVALSIVTGLGLAAGGLLLPVSGFLGAIAVILLIYLLSLRKGLLKIQGLLLTGVMISFVTSSLMMLMMAVSKAEELQGIVFWIMGSLEEPNWNLIKLALTVALSGLVVSYFFCSKLNALALGEDEARHLGIDTETVKRLLFLLASLLTGCSVAITGIIGFVGLVVPHFTRMYLGRDHRILLIGSFITGAVFLILCDTAARTIISPMELPVGVITGILGGSLFVYILGKREVAL
ncbi:MAG: iron ABC transporter permease [bacterium]|nr:iron ABC transporter permease [bacterium]